MSANTETASTYWVCVDCYCAADGVDENVHHLDREPLSLVPDDADITEGLMADEHSAYCERDNRDEWTDGECSCEEQSFSWSQCDGCGTRLGGTRHALTIWED